MPYVQGLSESIKNNFGKYAIQIYFKGNRTIKNIFVAPKDKDPVQYKSGLVYWYKCNRLDYDDEYIGESARTFGESYKEHLKAPSSMDGHHTITGHLTYFHNLRILGREGHGSARTIKESIHKGM